MFQLATISFCVSPGCVNIRDIAHDNALTTFVSGLRLDSVLRVQSRLQTPSNLIAQCNALQKAEDDSQQTTTNAICATVHY